MKDGYLKFLRQDNGMDVYLNLKTGKEVFLVRHNVDDKCGPGLFKQLERICHETLDIESRMQPLLQAGDEQKLIPLFNRLDEELLPEVVKISEGLGREMAFAHFALGLILRILRRLPEAERSFRRANELQPSVTNTLRELVRCLGEQKKYQDALAFAREAVKFEPMDAGVWGNFAMCLIQCNERDEARRAIDHAIKLDPPNSINCYIRDNFDGYFKS